jgi:hypothetical protein
MFDFLFERINDLLRLPWAPPLLVLAALVFIPPQVLKSRPRLYWAAVVTIALVLVCSWLLPMYLLPWLLPLVALVLFVFGLPEAHTFRRPEYFSIGIIAIAVGLCLWIPGYFIRIDNQTLAIALFLLTLFISGFFADLSG